MSRRPIPPHGRLTLAIVMAMLVGACSTLPPERPMAPAAASSPASESALGFDHAAFDRLLGRIVDARGRVDYAGLVADPALLDSYYAAVAAHSPDTSPERFPTRDHELAYWINAYNTAVLHAVAVHYPIESVQDVQSRALFFLPRVTGFFLLQRFEFGGKKINLYDVENGVVRERYAEPRIHFALNCASAGCPRLPAEAFWPERLEAQLERETLRFFAEPRNLAVDVAKRKVTLSSILDWYDDDFLEWLDAHHPELPRTLGTYAMLYAPVEMARQIRDLGDDYELDFREYDWSLNDQALPDPFAGE